LTGVHVYVASGQILVTHKVFILRSVRVNATRKFHLIEPCKRFNMPTCWTTGLDYRP